MTMAIGIMCHDGFVICADSMESDGYVKRNVDKLSAMLYLIQDAWGVAFAGAGEILDKFFADAIKEIQKCEGKYDLEDIKRAVERTLSTYRRRYRGNPLRIIMGIFNLGNRSWNLFRSDDSALSPISDYAQVGLGGALWEFLAFNFYHEDMSVDEGVALGAFILNVAGEHVDRVGGPTRIVKYETGRGLFHHPTRAEIAAILKKTPLEEFEELLRRYWRSRQKFKRRRET